MSFGLQTYDDKARREDLMDIIADVSPDSNPLSTMLGTTTATQTLHEWVEDYLSRPSSVSTAIEGAAATYDDLSQPARRRNVTQIIDVSYRVSGTESAVAVAGMGDPYNYQQAKALKDWKNKLEYALIRGAQASGDSGVARQMSGLKAVVTSHYTCRLSGSSLSETEFNYAVSQVWSDVGTENVFDLVLVPFGLKQKISTFTAGSTRYVDATDKKLTRPVMVYESDGGIHRIMAHKDMYNTYSSVNATTEGPTMIGIKEDQYKIAYLTGRTPKSEELAKDGDRRNGHIVGEATLEYRAERTSWRSNGYNQTG